MPLRNRSFAPPEQVAEVPSTTRPILPSKPQPDTRRIAMAKNFYDKSLNDNVASAFRGSSGAGSQDAVDRAIASWQNKDYREVIRQLNAVGPEHPRYYTAQLLLAHANFRTGRYEAAAAAARVIAGWKEKRNETYVEEAEWLLVLSLLAGGKSETQEFRSLSENISEDEGHPSYDQALALWHELFRDQSAPVAVTDTVFAPHPSMEAFVVSSSRSQGLKVKIISPQNDARFVPDTNGAVLIHFAGTLESAPAATLELRIFDNKQTNKPLLFVPLELKKDGQAGTQTFDLGQQLKVARGLYYFTIGQQGLTPAYAGRFVIRN